MNNSSFPTLRLSRFRQSASLRDMFATQFPAPEKFIWPTFIVEGKNIKEEISSMPGQFRYSIDKLKMDLPLLLNSGVKAIMLFGVIDSSLKSKSADYAFSPKGIVQRGIRELKKEFPELIISTDVCMCEYTLSGHCGILDHNGAILNDSSIEILAKIAKSHAEAGADIVAPSAMLDGQISAIRKELDSGGFVNTLLMSYSTKFASSFYGPFRDAADSAPASGDRKSYQADYRNANIAKMESIFDEEEGADILMVKPALCYLDMISEVKKQSLLPVAAYNVSGEYSMIHATAEKGWGNLYDMATESIFAINRAGADIIISYWANQYSNLG